jgi:hypothetical protein
MREFSKRVKRTLREYMGMAYERELHRELTQLDKNFDEWRKALISSRELSYRIHNFEEGPSRTLFNHYTHGSPITAVAYAIVTGILDEEGMPQDMLEAISNAIAFFRAQQEEGTLKDREGRWWE